MHSQVQPETNYIKEETFARPSFTDKFISVISEIQSQPLVTKDSVLAFVELFYLDNSLFTQLFQKSFLLLFKTYNQKDAKTSKPQFLLSSKGYEQLLSFFLTEMINMEFQVQKPIQQQQYFQNFIDFYLQFFAQALTSAKYWIKEFSFNILISSLKVMERYLQLQLYPSTKNQLLQSTFFLVSSKFQDQKIKGIELYSILRKLRIKCEQIQELLFYCIESCKNFAIRKMIIQRGICIDDSSKLDRLLHRLKDKNPLIVEEVVQKLLKQKTSAQILSFEQTIKLLVHGFGSCYQNVKNKTLQYFYSYFLHCIDNQSKQIRTTSFSVPSLDLSVMSEVKKQDAIQKLIGLFSCEGFQLGSDIFRQNPFISSLIANLIFEVSSLCKAEAVYEYVTIILKKIKVSQINRQQLIYLCSILKGISSKQQKGQKDSQVRKLTSLVILSIPSAIQLVLCFKEYLKLKLKNNSQLTSLVYLIENIRILVIQLDVYDYAGKRQIYQQLEQIIIQYPWFNQQQEAQHLAGNKIKRKESINKNTIIQVNLLKVSKLINIQTNKLPFTFTEMVNNHADLIFPIVQIMSHISKEDSSQIFKLKILINELFQSKELKFQRQMMKAMMDKTNQQIVGIKNSSQDFQKRGIVKLSLINQEIQKNLDINQQRIIQNHLKSLFILVKVLSIGFKDKDKNHNKIQILKPSDYLQLIKSQLQQNSSYYLLKNKKIIPQCGYMSLILLYFYCEESLQNYLSFKKLLWYYAFQKPIGQSILYNLSALVSTRLLSQLLRRYHVELKHFKFIENLQMTQKLFSDQLLNRALNKKQFQSSAIHFYKQIVLSHISNHLQFSTHLKCFQTDKITQIVKLIAQTLIQQLKNQGSQYNELFLKLLIIQLRQENIKFQQILCYVLISFRCLIHLLSDIDCFMRVQQKNIILFKAGNIISALLSQSQEFSNFQRYLPKTNQSLLKWVLTMRILQFSTQKTLNFTFLFALRPKRYLAQFIKNQHNYLEAQKSSIASNVQIQLLVFVKSQIQKFNIYLKTNDQTKTRKTQKYFLCIVQKLTIIDQMLQQQIFTRIYDTRNTINDQQSTQNSPSIYVSNISNRLNQKISPRVNAEKINFYDKSLKQEINRIQEQERTVLENVYRDKNFISLMRQQLNHENIRTIVNLQIQGTHQNNAKIQSSGRGTNEFNEEQKQKTKCSKGDFQLSLVSVKKSRFIIIPYNVIEKVEEQQKFTKNKYKGSIKLIMKDYRKSDNACLADLKKSNSNY